MALSEWINLLLINQCFFTMCIIPLNILIRTIPRIIIHPVLMEVSMILSEVMLNIINVTVPIKFNF
jgi:hypothetical protein